MVPGKGLEPLRLSTWAFKAHVSANSTIQAKIGRELPRPSHYFFFFAVFFGLRALPLSARGLRFFGFALASESDDEASLELALLEEASELDAFELLELASEELASLLELLLSLELASELLASELEASEELELESEALASLSDDFLLFFFFLVLVSDEELSDDELSDDELEASELEAEASLELASEELVSDALALEADSSLSCALPFFLAAILSFPP
jgi:hypothetical protein